jgi:type I restriction enzyme, S subunit
MTYKVYESYKDSGVEVVENIPDAWEIKKIKHVTDIYGRIGYRGYTVNDIVSSEEGVISLSPSNIINNKLVTGKNDTYISWDKYEESPEIKVFMGDIIFVKTASVGKVAFVDNNLGPATLNPQLIVMKNIKINKKFFFYVLSSNLIKNQVEQGLFGGVVGTLSQVKINNFYITIPSESEQEKIVDFLDAELDKVELVIFKKKKQIATLQQYRQSLITEAVTKGLDAEAPMRDSGVDWIGEVPEHWELCQLKRKMKLITDGAHISPETEDAQYNFISVVDLKKGKIDFENALKTNISSYNYLVRTGCKPQKGDVLLSKDGTIGKSVVVENEDFVVASSLIINRPNRDEVDSDFLSFLFQSNLVQRQLFSYLKGSALKRISLTNVKKIMCLFPPMSEQVSIANRLKESTDKIERLIDEIHDQIEILQNYSQSLIYEAVTGKIDVRKGEVETCSSHPIS